MRELQKRDASVTVTYPLEAARRAGNQLVAVIGSDYSGIRKEQLQDQIIVNHGIRPMDALYHSLQPFSTTLARRTTTR